MFKPAEVSSKNICLEEAVKTKENLTRPVIKQNEPTLESANTGSANTNLAHSEKPLRRVHLKKLKTIWVLNLFLSILKFFLREYLCLFKYLTNI